MTLFKFNPPGEGQENPTQAKTGTPDQAPVETEAAQSEADTPSREGHSQQSARPAQQVPRPPKAETVETQEQQEFLPRRASTVSTKRMLVEEPGGGKNALLVTILAILLVIGAIGLYIYIGEKPPAAAGEITKMWVYSVHTKTKPFAGEGTSGEPVAFDQVLILAQVKLRNQSKIPLFLWDMTTTLKKPDGDIDASAVGRNDFDRAFVAYPKMMLAKGATLVRETTLQPGQQIEGQILTHYTITKEEWEQRQGLNFTVTFRYQKSLVLTPPHEIEVIQ